MFSAPCDFVSTAPYSYKFGPSSGTALLTMTVADYSRQALLRQCCCIEVRESSSGKNAFFPTMYLLHLHLGFRVASGFILFCRLTHLRMPYAVSVRQVSGLPPASFRSRLAADTLALGYVLGATPCTRDFHPLERAHAERTNKAPVFRRGVVYVCLLPDGKVVLLVVRDFLLGFTAPAGLSDTALSADFMPNCVCTPKRLPKDDTLKRAENKACLLVIKD